MYKEETAQTTKMEHKRERGSGVNLPSRAVGLRFLVCFVHGIVHEKLLDKVDMGKNHSPAAIPF